MKTIKNISFFLIIAICISLLCHFLESDFIYTYLKGNIISLQVTLLAINTATLGLIASKIQDVSLSYETDFSDSVKEMKLSLKEQLILISTSILILILQNSKLLKNEYQEIIGNTLLTGVLIYSLNILWDTGKAVFVIIDILQQLKNNDEK